jgi:hypothetical protein
MWLCCVSLCWMSLCWVSLCWVTLCWVIKLNVIMLSVVMLNVIMMSVIMLNMIMLCVVMLNVNMLNVVMLSVVSPFVVYNVNLNIHRNVRLSRYFLRKMLWYYLIWNSFVKLCCKRIWNKSSLDVLFKCQMNHKSSLKAYNSVLK